MHLISSADDASIIKNNLFNENFGHVLMKKVQDLKSDTSIVLILHVWLSPKWLYELRCFLTRSDTNRTVQPQKMARGLKFPI